MQFILDEKWLIILIVSYIFLGILLFSLRRGLKTYTNLIYNNGEFRMLITSEHKQEVAAGKLHFSRSNYNFSLEEQDENVYLILKGLKGEYNLNNIYELFEDIMT